MFFTGSLQSGIALALQEAKFVACFLADGGDESKKWQESYLNDDDVRSALHDRAVLLRLESDSQEAAWLKAYYPVDSSPALVIINNGQQVLDLRGNLAKEQFRDEILRVLGRHDIKTIPTERLDAEASSTSDHAPEASGAASTKLGESQNREAAQDIGEQPTGSTTTDGSNRETSSLERLVARQKLEKARREGAAAEERQQETEPIKPDATATSGPKPVKTLAREKQAAAYAEQQRNRKQETRRERERVLGQIENDRQERREREERLHAAAASKNPTSPIMPTNTVVSPTPLATHTASQQCGIQVKLSDGTQIRQRFSPDQTIASDVRPWIEQKRPDNNSPFTLKQILSPLPNRPLSDTDETKSLADLGLLPNASLILVPVAGFADAYARQPGAISRAFRAVYDILVAFLLGISKTLGVFLGVGLEARQQQEDQEKERNESRQNGAGKQASEASSSGINIRTLYDQRKEKDKNEFYNGNQLNFEPRKDDDDDKKD